MVRPRGLAKPRVTLRPELFRAVRSGFELLCETYYTRELPRTVRLSFGAYTKDATAARRSPLAMNWQRSADSSSFGFGHAKPIAGIVFQDGFDPVELLFRRRKKFYSFGF
jgi:hypothetical protein